MNSRVSHRPRSDLQLVQIVDRAFADAARRSGAWLVCKPGCTQCCHGPFPINQLDVARLEAGLRELAQRDRIRAEAVRQRALKAVATLRTSFPGDPKTGVLAEDDAAIAAFEDFANDEPCPALEADGRCALYEHRPMTCRVFGPPIPAEGGLGHCELCYHGATPEQVAACGMDISSDARETVLNREVERQTGKQGQTIVAYALIE